MHTRHKYTIVQLRTGSCSPSPAREQLFPNPCPHMASALLAARRKSHGTINAAPQPKVEDEEFELVLLPRDGRFYSGRFEMVTEVGMRKVCFSKLFLMRAVCTESRDSNVPRHTTTHESMPPTTVIDCEPTV